MSPSPQTRRDLVSRPHPHSPLPPHKRPEYSVSSSGDDESSLSDTTSHTPSPEPVESLSSEELGSAESDSESSSSPSPSPSHSPSPSPQRARKGQSNSMQTRTKRPVEVKIQRSPFPVEKSREKLDHSPPSRRSPSPRKVQRSRKSPSPPPPKVQRSRKSQPQTQRSPSPEKPHKRRVSTSSPSSESSHSTTSPSSAPFSPPPRKVARQDRPGKKLAKPVVPQPGPVSGREKTREERDTLDRGREREKLSAKASRLVFEVVCPRSMLCAHYVPSADTEDTRPVTSPPYPPLLLPLLLLLHGRARDASGRSALPAVPHQLEPGLCQCLQPVQLWVMANVFCSSSPTVRRHHKKHRKHSSEHRRPQDSASEEDTTKKKVIGKQQTA